MKRKSKRCPENWDYSTFYNPSALYAYDSVCSSLGRLSGYNCIFSKPYGLWTKFEKRLVSFLNSELDREEQEATNMIKLKKFVNGLKKSQEILEALDEAGIDVDRLIGISNAQGPQAKIIKSVLTQVTGLIETDASVGSDKPKQLKARSPKKKSSKTTSP